ncbi:MAG: hypothetical protein ACK4TK_11100 [Thiobacillaceae bacterium]
MKNVEYRSASSAQGGLVVLRGVPGVAAGTRVALRDASGRLRSGLVIRRSLVRAQVGEPNKTLENPHGYKLCGFFVSGDGMLTTCG